MRVSRGQGVHERAALLEASLEEFVLNIGVHRQTRRLRERAYRRVCLDQPRQEAQIAGTFVLRALLRLDVQVNTVDAGVGMLLVELHHGAHLRQELVAVPAALVSVRARQQGLHADPAVMQQREGRGQSGCVVEFAMTEHRHVDFIDALGSAEIPQLLSAARGAKNRGALPHPQAVYQRCLLRRRKRRERQPQEADREQRATRVAGQPRR
jgi:hypothetical protein